jgi:hypothetical protein
VNRPQDTFLKRFQSENEGAGICGVLSSGQSPNWARYQVARVGGNEDIASDLSRFNTNYPTHLTSGVFLLVRPQLCGVPPCLYVRRVFFSSDFFTFTREAAGPPETSCYQTTRKDIP